MSKCLAYCFNKVVYLKILVYARSRLFCVFTPSAKGMTAKPRAVQQYSCTGKESGHSILIKSLTMIDAKRAITVSAPDESL